ncbi:cation diffusion facilitator family transporter [Sulfuritalea sp.]|uniref:cation diffusion facilitator family transporter n=1 Tax=Sulfuritalea sp. TaxID=2480090 RepID=UPI001AC04350|nr:cation diffusion facilitator family transporter [Sulfuritalea sp.]MBN8475505.1 cation transporter [Sulfuritalea sp.]
MNQHSHTHAAFAFNRAFAIGIALNLGFVVVEAAAGLMAGSLALLADAGHNLSDVAGLVLAWVAALAAGRLPDSRHTYGWQRASILAAFANAVLLLVAMGSLLWEAGQRLQAPPPTDAVTVMVVAAIGVLVNGVTAALFMSGMKSDMNLRGAFLHMAGDALVSLGVVLAGALYLWTGWGWLDPVASMTIALLIIVGTWRLFRQSLHLLFDGVPESVVLAEVDALLRAQPGVDDVHDLHVWAMSTTGTALTAHLVMPGGHPGDAFLEQVGGELHDRFHITHPTLQIELGGHDHGCARTLGE